MDVRMVPQTCNVSSKKNKISKEKYINNNLLVPIYVIVSIAVDEFKFYGKELYRKMGGGGFQMTHFILQLKDLRTKLLCSCVTV